MVKPARKHVVVSHLVSAHGISQRRVSRLTELNLSTWQYEPRRRERQDLRERLKELAAHAGAERANSSAPEAQSRPIEHASLSHRRIILSVSCSILTGISDLEIRLTQGTRPAPRNTRKFFVRRQSRGGSKRLNSLF